MDQKVVLQTLDTSTGKHVFQICQDSGLRLPVVYDDLGHLISKGLVKEGATKIIHGRRRPLYYLTEAGFQKKVGTDGQLG